MIGDTHSKQKAPCLLLVEDQFDLADLVEQALADQGNEVTHAYSVFEAMSLLKEGRFDAAILDVELRDGMVFPVADRLADLGVPYLFASAVYEQVVPMRHQKARFVPKPFHIPQLQEAVNATLAQARRRSEG
ncbi:response regulator [Stenotrophomonas sp.]|jgi:DNA-binding response OmpR family regulator|uniref:response regulator n=1 Tax=Stenotrophomonas sp. TaxID=69392 RepID=UPI00289D37EF|nr:response regulator [Stenotrophomonas sp.]